jgi:hypothetical protein
MIEEENEKALPGLQRGAALFVCDCGGGVVVFRGNWLYTEREYQV